MAESTLVRDQHKGHLGMVEVAGDPVGRIGAARAQAQLRRLLVLPLYQSHRMVASETPPGWFRHQD